MSGRSCRAVTCVNFFIAPGCVTLFRMRVTLRRALGGAPPAVRLRSPLSTLPAEIIVPTVTPITKSSNGGACWRDRTSKGGAE